MFQPEQSQLTLLERDLRVAAFSMTEFNDLTPSAFRGVAGWFHDVEVSKIFPLPAFEFSAEERAALLTTVIAEMTAAVTDARTQGLTDQAAFARLAPVLDPLWREMFNLMAEEFNAEWEERRPQDEDEREQLIRTLEQITGMSRLDMVEQARIDENLHAMISSAGLTLSDLDSEH